jgi:acetyl-CoA C-acetyltransferase
MTTPRRAAIIGGNRIPFARSNTVYSNVSNQDMLTATFQGLVDRFNLHGQRLGDVAAGAVMKHSRDFNLVRESVLSTTLSPETPAYDLQQACGTGLEAIMLVANKISLGHIESGIGGGVDTTSDAPIGINEKMRKILMEANRAKTTMAQLKIISKIRPSMLVKPAIPKNGEPRTGYSMGEHAELMAREWSIPREEQDQLTVASHANMARAYKEGFFADLMTPFKGVSKDNNLREGLSIEKLRSLKPCFDKKIAPGQGTLTPGNSTPLTDGASAVLLGSEEWAKERNLPVLAYITHAEVAAVDFFNKKEGLLMAPAYAVPRMLARAGLTLQDFDFYEIHEAFAAQVLCTLKAWEDPKYCKERLGLDKPLGKIDRSKLNVNGSSLAAGHPFAATGGRIVASLAKMLSQKGSGRGLISICAAGGQGVVAIIER